MQTEVRSSREFLNYTQMIGRRSAVYAVAEILQEIGSTLELRDPSVHVIGLKFHSPAQKIKAAACGCNAVRQGWIVQVGRVKVFRFKLDGLKPVVGERLSRRSADARAFEWNQIRGCSQQQGKCPVAIVFRKVRQAHGLRTDRENTDEFQDGPSHRYIRISAFAVKFATVKLP
ncbi:MAG: hypothetical protein NXI24_25010 [bacterium]|nr:hypothetical protein [bacterium]